MFRTAQQQLDLHNPFEALRLFDYTPALTSLPDMATYNYNLALVSINASQVSHHPVAQLNVARSCLINAITLSYVEGMEEFSRLRYSHAWVSFQLNRRTEALDSLLTLDPLWHGDIVQNALKAVVLHHDTSIFVPPWFPLTLSEIEEDDFLMLPDIPSRRRREVNGQ